MSGIADIWNTLDLDQMMQIFTEESRVEYIDKDPVVGLKAIRAMLADNFSNIATYELKKIARLAVEPEITTELDIKWTTKSEPREWIKASATTVRMVWPDPSESSVLTITTPSRRSGLRVTLWICECPVMQVPGRTGRERRTSKERPTIPATWVQTASTVNRW